MMNEREDDKVHYTHPDETKDTTSSEGEFDKEDMTTSEYQEFNAKLCALEQETFLSRYRSSGMVSVTDLIAVHWCDVQVAYALKASKGQSVSRLKKTKAMIKGTERHDSLEKEFHEDTGTSLVLIENLTSEEDVYALHWFHVLYGLWELQCYGVSREFPVMSVIPLATPCGNKDAERPLSSTNSRKDSSILVLGIVDEIFTNERVLPYTSVTFREVKTRASNRLPSLAQRSQAEFQVMMYGYLFYHMVRYPDAISHYARHSLHLDMNRPLAPELQEHIRVSYLDAMMMRRTTTYNHAFPVSSLRKNPLLSTTVTLEVLWSWVTKEIARTFNREELDLHHPTKIMYEIHYEHEDEFLGSFHPSYQSDDVDRKLRDSLAFWTSSPFIPSFQGLPIEDLWKCSSCEFLDICEWRRRKSLSDSKSTN